MFTGIVTDVGEVVSVDDGRGDVRFVIKTNLSLDHTPIGASICCSGCCLTVVECLDDTFTVDVSEESLSKTNLRSWGVGTKVNLEHSLKMGDELGGHFVFGHVDGVATLESIVEEGDSHRITVRAPDEYKKYIASKGSVTLNGVSLTVNEVDGSVFGINLIPHTWECTTFSLLQTGDLLNFETDMLARYVVNQMEALKESVA